MKPTATIYAILLSVLLLIPAAIYPQQQKQDQNLNLNHLLEMMDDPNSNFYDVQKYADEYFKIRGTERGTGYKQFKRWEAEMQFHIDEKGNRINPRSYHEEFKKFQSNYGSLQRTNAAAWEDLGPFDWNRTSSWSPGLGRIDCIAVDPQDNNTLFVGSPEGGCWKTTNGGTTWTSLTDGLTYMKIGAVAVDPSSSNTVYVGTNGMGMLKSTNGGTTLTQINTGYSSTGSVRKILVDPTNTQTILIATSGGIYRSTNGGTNWTRVSTVSMYDLEFKPGATSTVYACGNSFYKSTDNGATWTNITSGLVRSDIMRIAVTPADPNIVYAVQCAGSVFGSFYKSTDSGTNFTETISGDPANGTNYFGYSTAGTDNSGQGGYNICIAASPTDANEIHIGGIITWKSTNGGTSFVSTTAWTYPNSLGYTHCDMHELVYIGNTLFVGSDGGISKSTDKGDNFTNLSKGLGIRMFYRLGCSKTDVDMIAVGAQDNGGSIRKSTGWIDWLGADGMEAAIDPNNANIVYGSSQNGTLYKSTNGGTSQSGLSEPETSGVWTTPFLIDPNNANTLIAGYVQIYKSTNGASSWTAISNFTGTTKFNFLAMAPSNSNYIFAARGATIYRTTNGGTSWTDVSAGLGGATINRIDVHNSDPNKVAVAVSGSRVYTSTDGGTTWINYTGNLPAITARCLVYENGPEEGIYVGTTSGVYYRNKSLTGWVLHGTGLPNVPINEIEIQYTAKKVRVATYGRGVWQTDQYTAVTTSVNGIDETDGFSIYPNPNSGLFTIQNNSSTGTESEVTVMNVLGEIIWNGNWNHTTGSKLQIDLSGHASGIYYVKVRTNAEEITKKLMLTE